MFDLQLAAKELPLHVTCCSVVEAAPHFAISDFNSQFHTSLVHLMHWKMDTDGFGERQSQDGKILHACHRSGPSPLGQGYGTIFILESYYVFV